jgi:hypothetical protein
MVFLSIRHFMDILSEHLFASTDGRRLGRKQNLTIERGGSRIFCREGSIHL